MRRYGHIMVLCIISFGFLFVFGGCSSLQSTGSGVSGASSTPRYYDGFNDILIPGELQQNKKASSVFQSDGFAAGILVFEGRVESNSLISFFKENMVKDNWKHIGSITAPRTILLFQKENRWCVMNITEGGFDTQVEIGIVPTVSSETSKSMK